MQFYAEISYAPNQDFYALTCRYQEGRFNTPVVDHVVNHRSESQRLQTKDGRFRSPKLSVQTGTLFVFDSGPFAEKYYLLKGMLSPNQVTILSQLCSLEVNISNDGIPTRVHYYS
jgi:hypothetical protein